MSKAKVLVLTGNGTNCERETAYAAVQAGADDVVTAFFSDLLQDKINLQDFNLLVFPGGFLDGDHLGAAQVATLRLKYAKSQKGNSIMQAIFEHYRRGGLILGICNGFQLLMKLGLLPALNKENLFRKISLSYNDSARYEDRWVYLQCNSQSPCIFTRNLQQLFLPVRHGEGKLIAENSDVLNQLQRENLIALQYTDEQNRVTQDYPYNPNGSPLGIAGITDPTGRVFGLMPHPEACNHPTNHPYWTRNPEMQLGTVLFENAVNYLKKENISMS